MSKHYILFWKNLIVFNQKKLPTHLKLSLFGAFGSWKWTLNTFKYMSPLMVCIPNVPQINVLSHQYTSPMICPIHVFWFASYILSFQYVPPICIQYMSLQYTLMYPVPTIYCTLSLQYIVFCPPNIYCILSFQYIVSCLSNILYHIPPIYHILYPIYCNLSLQYIISSPSNILYSVLQYMSCRSSWQQCHLIPTSLQTRLCWGNHPFRSIAIGKH